MISEVISKIKSMVKPSQARDIVQEIATVERDIFNPPFSGIMRLEDQTLLERGGSQGLKIYDDIERDGHVYAVLQKRKMSVCGLDWCVKPISENENDKAVAEFVEEKLKGFDFSSALIGLLDAILKGYAVGEVIWQKDETGISVKEIKMRDQRRFTFDTEGNPRLLTYEDAYKGIELPDRKFIVHRFGSKCDNPFGLGLGTRLYWLAFIKKRVTQFWLTYLDKYASPTAIGKYNQSHSQADQKKLLQALASLSTDAGIIIPEGMSLELVSNGMSNNDNYERLMKYLDEQISECVLGETLSTNIGNKGSMAASQTHNEVRRELTVADADLLAQTLNKSLIKWIVDLNFNVTEYPKFEFEVEEQEDLTTRAQRDEILYRIGFGLTLEEVMDIYGDGYVEINKQQAAEKPILPPPQPQFAEGSMIDQHAQELKISQLIDRITFALTKASNDQKELIMDKMNEIIKVSNSYEEAQSALLDLWNEYNPADLAEKTQNALIEVKQAVNDQPLS